MAIPNLETDIVVETEKGKHQRDRRPVETQQ
jgi:hypothetical protein